MIKKISTLVTFVFVAFSLFLSSCELQEGKAGVEITQTIPYESSTPTQLHKTEMVETEEPTLAAPPPGFPIQFPRHTHRYTLSNDNKKVAVSSIEKETGEDQVLYNVLVNDIPIRNDWKSLFTPDDLLKDSPSLSFSPGGQYLAVSVEAWPSVGQQGAIWIFRTSDWECCTTFEFDLWYRPIVWSQDEQSVAFRSMEYIRKIDDILLSGDDFFSLLGIDGKVSSFLSPDEIFPERDEMTPPQAIYYGFGPAWSPDGKYIAYLAMMPGNWPELARGSDNIITGGAGNFQLVLIDTATSQKEIVYEGSLGGDPIWSPDGNKILFRSNYKMQVFDIRMGMMETIFASNQLPPYPFGVPRISPLRKMWTPDSQSVIFDTDAGYYIVEIEDGSLRELDFDGKDPFQFTADGKWLIYHGDSMLDVIAFTE